MKPRPVAYFLCAISLALIAVCPFILFSGRHIAAEAAPYKGILTLWHISGWRAGESSLGAFLSRRVREFEADYAYAFIEVESLTEEEAAQAIAAGEMPDLISYPQGKNPGVALQPLPSADAFLPNPGEEAWAYACGGYCLLVNTDLLTQQGADIPENGWGIRPETLSSLAQYGVCFDAEPGFSALPALAMHQYPESEETSYSTWGEPEPPAAMLSLAPQSLDDGLDAFLDGDSAILIASHRQLYEAEQAFIEGHGPAFFAYAIGGYTDMVQMIGIASCEDDKKLSACMTFLRYLLSKSAQKKLESTGTMPVVSNLEIYSEDECRRTIYNFLNESAALPEPGDMQELNILAAKALGGDESALKELKERLGG